MEASELSSGDSLSHGPLLISVSSPDSVSQRGRGLNLLDTGTLTEDRRTKELQEMWPRKL